MAELYANCTVSHKMHSDRRFDLLAELGGWTRNDACFRMVQLWARCTALKTDRPPAEEIRIHLGLRGEQLLLDAVLGERHPDGSIRVVGGGLTGGDTDRFGWYEPIEQRNVSGGLARADQARRTGRGPGGRFAPAGTTDHQRDDQQPSSVTSGSPAYASASPASGFRIPEEEDLSPSACAILQSVPEPAPTTPAPAPSVPAVSPPPAIREDIARTNTNYARDPVPDSSVVAHPCDLVVSQNTRNAPENMRDATLRANPPPAPLSSTYNPDDPRARGRLAEATYRRVSDARIAIAAELKLPAPLPFPPVTPGSRTRGLDELSTRIREEGAIAPAACDRVVENLVKQARAKRSLDWLSERAFGDKAWPNARDGIDPSARPAAARRGDPAPPAPAPARPERPPPDPVVSPEDMAAMRAMAASAATAPERGREIATLPTAELVKLYGDGQRVPSASADPSTDDEPRKKRKAAT